MSRGLTRARDRYEATPRSLDDEEMSRIIRGDRGCLGDLLSGFGALTLVVGLVLGAMNIVALSWAYVGAALWVGGFFWGTYTQSKSGTARKVALESGPLVLAVVLRAPDWLRRPGKRVGRAVVMFTTDPARRFDRDWLEAAAETLEDRLGKHGGDERWVSLRALLADSEAHGMHEIPAELLPETLAKPTYLASVMIHPERLESAYLGGDDDLEAGERDEDLDVDARPPTIIAIAEPERGFLEQVPQVSGDPVPEAEDEAAASSDRRDG